MRSRKPTRGKVAGAKFAISKETEQDNLKKAKQQLLKEIADQEKNKKEWYDKEFEKNLGKV